MYFGRKNFFPPYFLTGGRSGGGGGGGNRGIDQLRRMGKNLVVKGSNLLTEAVEREVAVSNKSHEPQLRWEGKVNDGGGSVGGGKRGTSQSK